MSVDDPGNIVLTNKEVKEKLDRGHICLMPQDDNNIQVSLRS